MKNDNPILLTKISIRTRLVLFYSLAAFSLLTVISLFLYWETINILYKADYQFLSDEVDTTEYILNNKAANLSALNQEVVTAPTKQTNSIYRYFIRVYDEKKQLVIETPGMSTVLPKPLPTNANRKVYHWFTNQDSNYLLIQAPIKLGNDKAGIIEIILDISYQHAVISDRKILVIALCISSLCSLLLGLFVSYRGMRSLYVLTKTAKNITATSLHQRIDPKFWPTELRALGHAFNEMLDRIESSFIRLKQFSSDLAHELRTPVSNLLGQTEIILSHEHSIPEYQQVLASNLEELQRISQLMENILFLARAENPQLAIKKMSINARDEIMGICEYYQALADEKNIQLLCEGDATLQADPVMFRRMISNILSNALNYTQAMGKITFNIEKLNTHSIKITATDTGCGIAKEHLPHLFDRFYRVDSSRTQHPGGTGLGLAIVKSIINLHRGTIAIASEYGRGTVISVTLP